MGGGIRALGPGDDAAVVALGPLLDEAPQAAAVARFLSEPGHHLLVACEDGEPVGFISGVETTHPDKGTEMFLYELSVGEDARRRGHGRALVEALAALARELGCFGMWVGTEADNVAALATYASAGGQPPEPFVTITWEF